MVGKGIERGKTELSASEFGATLDTRERIDRTLFGIPLFFLAVESTAGHEGPLNPACCVLQERLAKQPLTTAAHFFISHHKHTPSFDVRHLAPRTA